MMMMRGLFLTLAAAAIVRAITSNVRQAAGSEISGAISALPDCATPCVNGTIAGFIDCAPDDVVCLCSSTDLAHRLLNCVQTSCSIRNLLSSVRVYKETCQIPPTVVNKSFRATYWTLGGIVTVAIMLRILSRLIRLPNNTPNWSIRHCMTLRELGWDDLFIVLAFPFIFMNFYMEIEILYVRNGMGSDVWMLTPDQLNNLSYWFAVGAIIYCFSMGLVRASFIFFLLRVFGTTSKAAGIQPTCLGPLRLKLRHAMLGSQAFNFVLSVLTMVALTGICHPFNFQWENVDGANEGWCLSRRIFGKFVAILAIVFDCWLVYIPLSQIPGLNLTPWRKIGIMAIFGLGTLFTILSAIRLSAIYESEGSPNLTKDNFAATAWTILELWAAAICACLPALRILFVRVLPQIAGRALKKCSISSGGSSSQTATLRGSEGDDIEQAVIVFEVKTDEGSKE